MRGAVLRDGWGGGDWQGQIVNIRDWGVELVSTLILGFEGGSIHADTSFL
jgi:hypothetical protein